MHCPAKINICLSVTGKRPDGYHSLVSLVVPLAFGDQLSMSWHPGAQKDTLECQQADIPTDETNLVLRAAKLMRSVAVLPSGGLHFKLHKRIPHGAGLGGGSSNGSAALMLMNRLLPTPLPARDVHDLAAKLGSDCPLFLSPGATIVRGRGEHTEPVSSPSFINLLAEYTLVLCKPFFAINTPWAFQQLAANRGYRDAAAAEHTVRSWLRAEADDLKPDAVYNSFEPVVAAKYPVIGCLLNDLRSLPGVLASVSGSGSCCFALINTCRHPASLSAVQASALRHFGPQSFITTTAYRKASSC